MPGAFVQQVQFSKNGSGQTTVDAPAFTPSAGNTLVAVVWVDGPNVSMPAGVSLSDTTGSNGTWTRIVNTELSSAVGTWVAFFLPSAAATLSTIRATLGSSYDFPAIYVAEFSGLAASPLGSATDATTQMQISPGTGTDAITSGNTSTLSGQPALVFGFAYQTSGIHTPTAGTGYTSLTGVWDFEGSQAVSVRPEWKRVTATTAVAGTATSSDAVANYMTLVIVLQEAASSATLKTFNGMTDAVLKTIDGLTKANTKTVLGLTP